MTGNWRQVEVAVILWHRHLIVRIDIDPVVVWVWAVMSIQTVLVHASRAYHVMHPAGTPVRSLERLRCISLVEDDRSGEKSKLRRFPGLTRC